MMLLSPYKRHTWSITEYRPLLTLYYQVSKNVYLFRYPGNEILKNIFKMLMILKEIENLRLNTVSKKREVNQN